MRSRFGLFLVVLMLLGGCGGSKSQRAIEELQKKNDDLTARVKTLEDNLLASEKKVIQLQQALQRVNDRVRDMEGVIDQVRMGR